MSLQYSIVIATRNRPEALLISIPLMLSQTVKAAQIIISDSSDDPLKNKIIVEDLRKSSPIPITHIVAPKGSAIQRNLALEKVGTPIVAFPDDDSLMRIDAMERIISVYERDIDKKIGGVGGFELRYPDPGMLPKNDSPVWSINKTEKLRKRFFKIRNFWEDRVFTDPLKIRGRRLLADRGVPGWLPSMNTVPVEWITGFRMTYRTETVRKHKFDEDLGQYSLFEDIDLSLRVLQEKLVVTCLDAGIYHHRWPSNRANGRAIGAMHMLNRAFVLAKSEKVSGKERRAMWRWGTARSLVEILRARDLYGRQRRNGTIAAYFGLKRMLAAGTSDAPEIYLQLRKSIFTSEAESKLK